MSPHTFYPYPMPTAPSRRTRALRFARWLLVFMVLFWMVACTALVIVRLVNVDAQLDSAFLQGMTAGQQLCSRGG